MEEHVALDIEMTGIGAPEVLEEIKAFIQKKSEDYPEVSFKMSAWQSIDD